MNLLTNAQEENLLRRMHKIEQLQKPLKGYYYCSKPAPGTFDELFYERTISEKLTLENSQGSTVFLNAIITENEIRKSVSKAKANKAVGYDNIPNEVIKNDSSIKVLHALFNGIFQSGVMPSIWKKAIIKPIPKNSAIDPKVPMQYRAISLLSTVSKLYSSVLNNRLLAFAERNILHDEQNGFCPKQVISRSHMHPHNYFTKTNK